MRAKFHCDAERVPVGAMPEMRSAIAHFTANGGLDYHAPSPVACSVDLYPPGDAREYFSKENIMSKSQDAKKNLKKAPTRTPKEKKEAKRLKKAEKKH